MGRLSHYEASSKSLALLAPRSKLSPLLALISSNYAPNFANFSVWL